MAREGGGQEAAGKQNDPAGLAGMDIGEQLEFALAIIEAAPSLTYVYDVAQGRNVYISEQSARILGYSPAEIAAMGPDGISGLVDPEDAFRTQQRLTQILASRKDELFELEYRMRRKDGGIVWLLSRDRVFKRGPGGEPLQILGVATDITERKQSEEILLHAKTSLELALDGGEAAPWQYNVQTRDVEWSPRGYSQLGLDPGSSQPSLDIYVAHVHPDDVAVLLEVRERERDAPAGAKYKVQIRLRRNDGSMRWIERRSIVGLQEPAGKRIFGIDIDISARMAAEERLLAHQELLTTVVGSTPDLVWAKDRQGRITLANTAAINALGGGESTRILGRHAADIFQVPALARKMDEDDTRIMERGEPETIEEELNISGWHSILQTVKAPLLDGTGSVRGVVGVSRDVTAQREAERTLAEQKALLEAIGASSPDLIFAKDLNLRLIYANPATLDFLGKTADHVLGHITEDLTAERSEGESYSSNDRQVMESGVTAVFYEATRLPDGREIVYRSRKSPLKDASGRIIGTVGVAVDITETRAIEAALRESEERLAAALKAGQLGVFDHDPASGAIKWDATLREIWGVGEDENITPAIFQSGIHLEDWPAVERAIANATKADGDGRYRAEYRVINRSHRGTRWVQAEGNMIFRSGAPVRFVGTIQDITERKRSELQIHMLMREVNHRSKNMLAVVQAIANQTSIKGDPRTFARRFTERLQGLAASHDLLVNNSWQGIDLAELVGSQLAHFRDLVRKRITFDGPDIRITPAAAQALGIALHELATNAGIYGALSGEKGDVLISWQVDDTQDPPLFRMTWVESGGPPVTAPAQRGFGTRLLAEMTELALQGKVHIDYAKPGFNWKVETPAGKIIERGRKIDREN